MNTKSELHMDTHVPVLGWLYVISSIFLFIFGVLLLVFLIGIGVAIGGGDLIRIMGILSAFLGGVFTVLSLPGILAGIGLIRRKTWGRVLALVLGFLSLLNFPFGTVIGVYALYVLLQEGTAEYFS